MRAVTRGTGALTQGEDAGWSGVSVWGSRWWWFTLLIWIKPLVMTDKNIKMSCDQCPLPGAGSGEIGIRVPSSRHLNWVRETGSREIISGAREYWLHFRGCTQHTSMMLWCTRNVFMTRRSDQERFSVSALIFTKTNLFLFSPFSLSQLFLWGTKWITS